MQQIRNTSAIIILNLICTLQAAVVMIIKNCSAQRPQNVSDNLSTSGQVGLPEGRGAGKPGNSNKPPIWPHPRAVDNNRTTQQPNNPTTQVAPSSMPNFGAVASAVCVVIVKWPGPFYFHFIFGQARTSCSPYRNGIFCAPFCVRNKKRREDCERICIRGRAVITIVI